MKLKEILEFMFRTWQNFAGCFLIMALAIIALLYAWDSLMRYYCIIKWGWPDDVDQK